MNLLPFFSLFVIIMSQSMHYKPFLDNFKSHKGVPKFSFLPCCTPGQHVGYRRNLEPDLSPVTCIRGVRLSNPGLFNFAMNSVKLAFIPAWLNLPKSQGSCDPSWHLSEPHLQGWGSFALLATAEICCGIPLYLPGDTSVGREKLQLHNRKQNIEWSTKLPENGVCLTFVQRMTGKGFLGKVIIPRSGNSSLWAASAASRLTPLGCASKWDKKRGLCFQQKEK